MTAAVPTDNPARAGGSTPPIGRVALLGAGMMGGPIAAAFATRYPTLLYDLDSNRVEAVVADTLAAEPHTLLSAAHDPAELVGCDVVVTMLPDSNAVQAALIESGFAGRLAAGSVVIDMSSSVPDRTRELARTLSAQGLQMLDAPVSGGVARAVSRQLTIMAGGPQEVLDRCRPLLETVASSVLHTGGPGTGHAAKALNNLLSACGLLISTEAVLAGQRYGLDPQVLLELFNSSTGRNHATETKIAQYVLSGQHTSGFRAALMVKDLRIALELIHNSGVESGLADGVLTTWESLYARLPDDADQTAIADLINPA